MRILNGLFALTVSLSLTLAAPGFTVSSPAFVSSSTMPSHYTCVGAKRSPPLVFINPPAGTKSFAILGWDDDAPGGLASLWVLYDLPPTTTGLPANVSVGAMGANFKQGKNTYGKLGYSAPCANTGKTHRVYFDLYALDSASLGLPAGARLEAVHAAIKRHRIQEAKLMGLVR